MAPEQGQFIAHPVRAGYF